MLQGSFESYAYHAEKTALYRDRVSELVRSWEIPDPEKAKEAVEIIQWAYITLGLCGEAGEIANKVKKVIRDGGSKITPEFREDMKDEGGDVLWYLSELARKTTFTLWQMAAHNVQKLLGRQARGVLGGSGDKR